jgi:hypothetical protein
VLRYPKWLSTFALALLLSSAALQGAGANSPTPSDSGPLASFLAKFLTEPVRPPGQTAGYSVGSTSAVTLLSSISTGVTFEVRVPWEQLILEPVMAGGTEYVRVSLPGWMTTAQAGAPVLPFVAEAIGTPFGVSVAVRVVPGPVHTWALAAPVLPMATEKMEWDPLTVVDGVPAVPAPSLALEEDPAVYASQAAYPRELAQVSSDGVLRQQRVVGLAAYPVQYDPGTRKLTVYEWLRVEVSFEGPAARAPEAQASESAAYESLFRLRLLNYETARQWRQTLTPDPNLTPNPSPTAGLIALGEGSDDGTNAGVGAGAWAPPVPGWRVKVRAEGLYKLTYAELLAGGLPVDTLDPRTFQLYNLGSEAAIEVAGQGDGRFDPADYVLFYGQAVASKYTADNVYWLTYGQETGLRMATRNGTPGGAETPACYPAAQHMEKNQYYLSLTPGDDNVERWMWDYIYAPSRPRWSYTFSITAPYTAQATLKVAMVGYLQNGIDPDHHVRISLNGTQVADVAWDGIAWHTVETSIAPGLLVAGSNTLSVVCPNDTGVGYDVVYVDSAELEYASTFRAEGDGLPFRYDVGGTWKYQVDGFSSHQVAVYDVTLPAAVVRIEGISAASSGLGYVVQFQDEVVGATSYWAVGNTAYRTVQAIEQDTASNLQWSGNGADHIVIFHRDFETQAGQLRDFRAGQGMRAVAVDVQDVYDEFGYGVVGAGAIHDFVEYAYSEWEAPAPSYVVLVGDGHYDPKNYLGYGRVSFIPPYLAFADPWVGETAVDNRYVTVVGGDTFPDLMLGRLAVNSSAEASAFVNKIVAYEESPVSGQWRQQVLAVADNADSAGNFAQASDELLADCLPVPYAAEKVYYGVTHTALAGARAAILAGISAGKLIVNFVGHAAVSQWADEGLFRATDIAGLRNAGKLPVVLAMTCRDGAYQSPSPIADAKESLAELITRAEGKGAVASWSPTGLGIASGHDHLDRGFFEARFEDAKRTLGEATLAGKLNLWVTGNNLDLIDTFLLFGDPALRLGLPADLDADCDVDVLDIMLVASHWNSREGEPQYDARYDLDADGDVDIGDIMLVASQWNTHC